MWYELKIITEIIFLFTLRKNDKTVPKVHVIWLWTDISINFFLYGSTTPL